MFKSLIRNRSAEKDIRDWLSEQGLCGRTAEFAAVELHAIKRPGWLQVFRFEVCARNANDEWLQLFGAMRADERYGAPKVMVDLDPDKRNKQLADWSQDLITKRPAKE